MKKKYYLVISAVAIALVALIALPSLGKKKDKDSGSPSVSDVTEGEPASEREGSLRSRKNPTKQLKKYRDMRLAPYFDGEQQLIEVEKLEGYLRANNRSPKSLVAVYWLTKDKEILAELKRHQDVPDVALNLAMMKKEFTPDERLEFAKTYIGSKPNEMQGYLLAAEIMTKKGSNQEAVEMMQKALFAEVLAVGDGSVSSDMKVALTSTGMDPTAVGIHLSTNDRPVRALLMTGMDMIGEVSKIEIQGAKSKEDKYGVISKYINSAFSMNELSGYVDRDLELYYQVRMKKLLSQIPDDVDLGGDLGSSKELAARLKGEERSILESRRLFYSTLKYAAPQQVDQFFQQREILGEPTAEKWFVDSFGG